MSFALSLLAATLFGVGDFLCGLAARRGSTLRVLGISQAAGAIVAAAFVIAGGLGFPLPEDIPFAALAGISGVVGLAFLYRGLARGSIAIVSPLSALIAALLPALYGAITGERPSPAALAGAALCIPAILLLSWQAPATTPEAPRGSPAGRGGSPVKDSLVMGAAAGIFLGGFYTLVSRCQGDSGLPILLVSRMASLASLGAFALARLGRRMLRGRPRSGQRGQARSPERMAEAAGRKAQAVQSLPLEDLRPGLGLLWPAAFALFAALGGVFDMSANLAFLRATKTGLLMIVSIVTSLFPAPTVLLARIVLKERISYQRLVGIGLAFAGMIVVGFQP